MIDRQDPYSGEELHRALGQLPMPVPPPVTALLDRAFPETPKDPRTRPKEWLLEAAVAATVVVAIAAPSPKASHTWIPGLLERGAELANTMQTYLEGIDQ